MSDLLATLEADRQREYRRMVLVSLVLHGALMLLFLLRAPSFDKPSRLPPVVSLVSASELAPPRAEAPVPAPAPAPPEAVTPAPPKKPEIAKTVIPLDNQKQPKPKKRAPEPEDEPEPVKKKPVEEEQVDLDEYLETLREEVPPGPAPTAQPSARPVAGPSGPGELVTPEVLAWMNKVKAHARRKWGHDPRFRGKALRTEVLVTLTASGDVLDFEITRRSGNPWYDESVERFLLKESPLPPPPDGGEWPISFSPGDLL